jgi:hypothetical protein
MRGERVGELAEWFAASRLASVVMSAIASRTATTVDMSDSNAQTRRNNLNPRCLG